MEQILHIFELIAIILFIPLVFVIVALAMLVQETKKKFQKLRSLMINYVNMNKGEKPSERWLAFRAIVIGWLVEIDRDG
jgi:hypothetical protein